MALTRSTEDWLPIVTALPVGANPFAQAEAEAPSVLDSVPEEQEAIKRQAKRGTYVFMAPNLTRDFEKHNDEGPMEH